MAHAVVWFDMPVLDLDRAIRFYASVLGVPVTKQEVPGMSIGVFSHGEGEVSGCLHKSDHDRPSDHGALLYFNVQGRLDQAAAAVEPNGGKIVKPRHSIAPYGNRVLALDSEGNRVALHSM